jgi:predicted permease
MNYLITYYIIGLIVSMYFIYYYRLSNKTKSSPSKNDAWLALIGPWVFPLQIVLHFFKRKN